MENYENIPNGVIELRKINLIGVYCFYFIKENRINKDFY